MSELTGKFWTTKLLFSLFIICNIYNTKQQSFLLNCYAMSSTKTTQDKPAQQPQKNGQGRRYLNGAMSGIVEVSVIYSTIF